MGVYYTGIRQATEPPPELEEPFVERRYCTTCMHRNVWPDTKPRVVATHVAWGEDGAQWFACQACVDAMVPSFDNRAVQHMELNRWAREHGLPEFDVRTTVRRELAASSAQMDQAQAELEA